MRIGVCGRNLEDLYEVLADFPVEYVQNNPDLIISYGGDGTLLGAERDYPGIPKCPVRDSRSNPKCPQHDEKSILRELFAERLPITELIKVQGTINNTDDGTCGINDVVVDRQKQSSAIRFRLWLNDMLYARHIVGDGIVLATPFGSSGYYRSITHSLFSLGIGLAFNNATEAVNHLVIDPESVIRLEILRGPGIMFADNDPTEKKLSEGDQVVLSKAASTARIIGLNTFRCPDCYWLRHHHERPLVPLA